MTDRDKIETFFDIVEDAKELYDENEDKIKNLVNYKGDENTIKLKEGEPTISTEVTDDVLIATIETNQDSIIDFDFLALYEEDRLMIDSGDNEWVLDLSEDAVVDKIDASVNNGVLDIQIPRDNNGGDDDGTDE